MNKLNSDYFIERRIHRQTMLVYLCLLLAVTVTATFYCAAMLDEQAAKQSATLDAQTVEQAVKPSVDLTEVIGIIAETQCFYSTDWCCEWAFGLFENSDDPVSAMHALVSSQCFEPTDSCLEFAFGLIGDPAAGH